MVLQTNTRWQEILVTHLQKLKVLQAYSAWLSGVVNHSYLHDPDEVLVITKMSNPCKLLRTGNLSTKPNCRVIAINIFIL